MGFDRRDKSVFGDPDKFRLDRAPQLNLLHGAGIHICPGAPLARLELPVQVEELLKRTSSIALLPGRAGPGAVSLPRQRPLHAAAAAKLSRQGNTFPEQDSRRRPPRWGPAPAGVECAAGLGSQC
ncbi:hypothetical protein GCM10009526_17140 [Glutamicibacter creatinolyticus]